MLVARITEVKLGSSLIRTKQDLDCIFLHLPLDALIRLRCQCLNGVPALKMRRVEGHVLGILVAPTEKPVRLWRDWLPARQVWNGLVAEGALPVNRLTTQRCKQRKELPDCLGPG